MTSPRIFVSIASYRDPECQHTVRDLFAKAAQPERISVGICWQVEATEDDDCFAYPPPPGATVREKLYHARDSIGGSWARAKAHALIENEDYVLQIDAHMRFTQGWDEKLLAALNACPSKNAAITGSLPGYRPPNLLEAPTAERQLITVHTLGAPDDPQLLHLGSILWPRHQVPAGLLPTPFFVGNFLFAPARMFKEIPYDPHIYFRGQEPAYAARLWTHGWDLFQPDEVLLYHYWQSKARGEYKQMNVRAELGRQRVLHLLAQKPAPAAALVEIDKYAMGTARSLADFWAFAGVNLETGIITNRANKGRWDKPIQ